MRQKYVSNTKINVLDAACQVIIEQGAEALTIEAVAQKAGISKGGFLYHFPAKKELIKGMIQRLIDEMESSLEEEMAQNGGNFLLAYAQVTIKNNDKQNMVSSALFAAIANDIELLRPLQKQYTIWQKRAVASAPSPEVGTLIRLAMDGLWIADIAGFAPPAQEIRHKLLAVISSTINSSK